MPKGMAISPKALVAATAIPLSVGALAIGLLVGYLWGHATASPSTPAAAATVTVAPVPEAAATTPESEPTPQETFSAADTSPFTAAAPRNVNEYGAVVLTTNPQAPLADVFIDFQCPYCKALEDSFAEPWSGLVADGKWQIAYTTLAFLGEPSVRAANAAACVVDEAGPEAWAEFAAQVYAIQDPAEPPTQFDNATLVKLATKAGAPGAAECINSGAFNDYVTEATQRGFARGVGGTPTVLVDEVQVSPSQIS
ncbi:MAG: thioredoxin domain-containing protein [Candidatus Nanopelagicales bacterium]